MKLPTDATVNTIQLGFELSPGIAHATHHTSDSPNEERAEIAAG